MALYYRRVYLVAKDDLEPDYLFLLDVLARMHNQSDFESVLATGDSAFVRHILVVASGLGCFALQAPPAIPGRDETPSAGSNPMLRLFVGLKEIMAYFRRDSDHGFVTLADILLDIETKRSFHAFEQTTIDAGLAACRDNMSGLNTLINGIWNPDVRGNFAKIIKIMLPYFTDREDSYAPARDAGQRQPPHVRHQRNRNGALLPRSHPRRRLCRLADDAGSAAVQSRKAGRSLPCPPWPTFPVALSGGAMLALPVGVSRSLGLAVRAQCRCPVPGYWRNGRDR